MERRYGLTESWRAGGKLAALLLMALLQAKAAALQPALVAGSAFFNTLPNPPGINITTFGTFSEGFSGNAVQAIASGTPLPYLSATADIISAGVTGRASLSLLYEISVVGPSGGVPVIANVAGAGSGFSATGDIFAGFVVVSRWKVEDASLGLALVFAEGIESGAVQGSFGQSFSHNVALMLTANHVYRVTMVVDVFAAAGHTGASAFATAFLDPTFSFGPGADPQYAFELSDGVGNSNVPEPGSAVLMISGLLVLRVLYRRGT